MSNDGTEPNRGKRSLAPVMLVMTAAAAAIGIIFAVVAILGAIFTAVSERGEKIVGAIYLPSDLSEGQVGILLATYGGWAGIGPWHGYPSRQNPYASTATCPVGGCGVFLHTGGNPVLTTHRTGTHTEWSGLLSYSYYVDVDCGSWFRRVSGVDTSVCQPEFESLSRIAMAFAAIGIAVPLGILVWETIIEKREDQEPNPS